MSVDLYDSLPNCQGFLPDSPQKNTVYICLTIPYLHQWPLQIGTTDQ